MRAINLTVFTDYACPFCYVAYRMCRELMSENALKITPVYMEIHDDLPSQGADVSFFFPENARLKMNEQLTILGKPYGIRPVIGTRLFSSKKAIIVRNYIKRNRAEYLDAYDAWIYDAYLAKQRDIGDEAVLAAALKETGTVVDLTRALQDEEARKDLLSDRRTAALHDVKKTPAFLLGSACHKGILTKEELTAFLWPEGK